ncbi:hypothetical protein [Mycolicibacterium nivoides]|uniref:hypothetical protein n=1 Tax=Mycolicibacterium nivoides TaxID=2487344 RepID=UPI000F5BB1E7|nr:hypothetical protein [Mycolicibacterium nivoides]
MQIKGAQALVTGAAGGLGSKGVTTDFVARRVIAAIEKNRAEVDAAELPVRIVARSRAWRLG